MMKAIGNGIHAASTMATPPQDLTTLLVEALVRCKETSEDEAAEHILEAVRIIHRGEGGPAQHKSPPAVFQNA